jgi:hypothetical protein
MQQQFDNQIALFIRDETTGRYVFNAQALKALGIDPAEARGSGIPTQRRERISRPFEGVSAAAAKPAARRARRQRGV